MRSAIIFFVTSLSIAATGQQAGASYYSAKGVVANCSSELAYDTGWCAGYLGAWADADIDRMRRKACIPANTGLGVLKQVVMDYADANTGEIESMTGGELLQRAFSRRWPTESKDDTVSEIYRKTC